MRLFNQALEMALEMAHLDIVGSLTLQGQMHLYMPKNGSLQTEGQNDG